MTITEIAGPIAAAVLKVAAVALTGFVLARRGVLHSDALSDLSNLVMRVTAPCLIFANAAGGFAGLSAKSAVLAIGSAPIVLGLGWLGGAVLSKLLHVKTGHWRAVLCASTFQNSSYLPLAIAASAAPPLAALFPSGPSTAVGAIAGSSVVSISLFGVLYSPLFWGLGLWWLTAAPNEEGGRKAWLGRLMPPAVYGVIFGYTVGLTPLHLALTPTHAPLHFLFSAITDIGSLTIPLANLILGGMLALSLGSGYLNWRDGVSVAVAKLLWVPGATLALLWAIRPWWGRDAALSVAAFVVFVQSLTPPATNLAVMTKGRAMGADNLAPQVMPGLLLVAYSLSLLTMPLWLMLFFELLQRQ